MTGFDILIIFIAGFSAFSGAMKGLIRSVFSFGAVVVGIVAALVFHDEAAAFISWLGASENVALVVGFLIPIGICVLLGSVISTKLRKTLKKTGLTSVDRLGGAGLGLVRAWLIGSAIFLAVTAFPIRISAVEQAVTMPFLSLGAQMLVTVASQDLSGKFQKGIADLKKLKPYQPPPPPAPPDKKKR
jgi:membrane protein required for colicin V production